MLKEEEETGFKNEIKYPKDFNNKMKKIIK